MKTKDELYKTAVKIAIDARDLSAYMDLVRAVDPDCSGKDEWYRQIYDAVHRSVKDIARAAGMPQYKMAEFFSVPRRTMEDWCRGVSKCPTYTRLMMQEILGILQRTP